MSTRAKLKRLASESIENHVQRTFEIDSLDIRIEKPNEPDDDDNLFNRLDKDTPGVEDVAKPFAITLCSKTYSRKWSLKLHRNVHAGVKPISMQNL